MCRTDCLRVAHVTTIDMSLRYLLLNQMRCQQKAGYEVTGISAPGPNVPAIEAAGLRHIAVPMTRTVTPVADLTALWRLFRVMQSQGFTIVHCHTAKAELLGQVAARLAGVPIVVNTFRGIPYRNGMHPRWRRAFVLAARMAAGCADVVLSQSQANRDMAIRERICPPEKIKVLGNGIDMERFDPRRLDGKPIIARRQELGLATGAPVVGFVGRLVAEKGVAEILQAAGSVLEREPATRFVLVGPVDQEKPDAVTPEIAQDYGVADACAFTGMRHDLPELYALMDVFALPSHRESFPRAPMEASAMGVPCVVADIPGSQEVVEHGRNGLRVPAGDVQALADAIVRLLTDKEEARHMGEEGRRMARKRFDERSVFQTVQAEYARLLREKGLVVPGSVSPGPHRLN